MWGGPGPGGQAQRVLGVVPQGTRGGPPGYQGVNPRLLGVVPQGISVLSRPFRGLTAFVASVALSYSPPLPSPPPPPPLIPHGGFDWVARGGLGLVMMESLNFFAIMPMPLNCRITDFGKQVSDQNRGQAERGGNGKSSCRMRGRGTPLSPDFWPTIQE